MQQCVVDFAGGLHGNFLAYALARFVYDIEENGSPLSEFGSYDGSVQNLSKYRPVIPRHYTNQGMSIHKDTSHVIYIRHTHTPKFDYIVANNVFFRTGLTVVNDTVENRTKELGPCPRLAWHWKLKHFYNEDGVGIGGIGMEPNRSHNLPFYEFDFQNFYDLDSFIDELQYISKFLGRNLNVNHALVDLWNQFITHNQGLHYYEKASSILTSLLNSENVPIVDDWMLQAYVLWRVQDLFATNDDALFREDYFPLSTKELLNTINRTRYESY